MSIVAKPNMLFTGDNLHVMHGMNSESVDLIYLDPPFNSKRLYSGTGKAAQASFKDMWTWMDVDEGYLDAIVEDYPYLVQNIGSIEIMHGKPMMSYITYMAQRIIEMHRILKPTGSFYMHIDPTASHYLKVVCDRIFGRDNFRNEIVWCYRGMPSRANKFQSKHDVILFYSKSAEAKFNVLLGEPSEASLKTFKRAEKVGYNANLSKKMVTVFDWEKYRDAVASGKLPSDLQPTEFKGGRPPLSDWWDLPILAPTSKERTGYPTQKPLDLLHRVIKASSDEGDVVLDPFCGCATTMVAAQQLGRKWLGIDISDESAKLVIDRLSENGKGFTDFTHTHQLPVRTDQADEAVSIEGKESRQQVKDWLGETFGRKCNACGMDDFKNLEVDHYIPKSRGGQDVRSNFQLLCGHCNRTKGDRPMEYLRIKIKERRKTMERVTFG